MYSSSVKVMKNPLKKLLLEIEPYALSDFLDRNLVSYICVVILLYIQFLRGNGFCDLK